MVDIDDCEEGLRTIIRKTDLRSLVVEMRPFKPVISHSGCRAGSCIDARMGEKTEVESAYRMAASLPNGYIA